MVFPCFCYGCPRGPLSGYGLNPISFFYGFALVFLRDPPRNMYEILWFSYVFAMVVLGDPLADTHEIQWFSYGFATVFLGDPLWFC